MFRFPTLRPRLACHRRTRRRTYASVALGVKRGATEASLRRFSCTSAGAVPETTLQTSAVRSARSDRASAAPKDFPVTPGAAMPGVAGCAKQDYAVLFIVGVEDKAATAAATAAASL